jgi:carbon monoxide dehydrogenase subunit G
MRAGATALEALAIHGRYTRAPLARDFQRARHIKERAALEMTGEELIPVSQGEAWRALNDTTVLKDCIPGCETLERLSDTQYQITMRAKIGPVSARFKGMMTLSDLNPPHAYTMTFEGQGGVAGFAKGEAQVGLAPEGGATRLSYSAKAMIGGKIAQLGARLIDGVARKLAEDFFSAFNARVSSGATSSGESA